MKDFLNRQTARCEYDNATGTCQCCRALSRPCTWTKETNCVGNSLRANSSRNWVFLLASPVPLVPHPIAKRIICPSFAGWSWPVLVPGNESRHSNHARMLISVPTNLHSEYFENISFLGWYIVRSCPRNRNDAHTSNCFSIDV